MIKLDRRNKRLLNFLANVKFEADPSIMPDVSQIAHGRFRCDTVVNN